MGFSLGRHFQSRRRLSCPCLLKNPYICAECGFSQILALKIKPVIAAKAKERQLSTLKQNTVWANLPEREEISTAVENQKLSEGRGQKGLSNLINLNAEAQAIQPVNTQKELAEMADVSTGTMAKIEKLVDNATPEIKQALRADSKHMETQGVYMDF